jgi:dsDNA-specific endonuclease/ATPase MutS2
MTNLEIANATAMTPEIHDLVKTNIAKTQELIIARLAVIEEEKLSLKRQLDNARRAPKHVYEKDNFCAAKWWAINGGSI